MWITLNTIQMTLSQAEHFGGQKEEDSSSLWAASGVLYICGEVVYWFNIRQTHRGQTERGRAAISRQCVYRAGVDVESCTCKYN